jgi:hypothetical protein
MTAEEKLAKIAAIYNTETKSADGTVSMTHAYYNIEGAIIDLDRSGKADRVIMSTLRHVRDQLAGIGRVLEGRE